MQLVLRMSSAIGAGQVVEPHVRQCTQRSACTNKAKHRNKPGHKMRLIDRYVESVVNGRSNCNWLTHQKARTALSKPTSSWINSRRRFTVRYKINSRILFQSRGKKKEAIYDWATLFRNFTVWKQPRANQNVKNLVERKKEKNLLVNIRKGQRVENFFLLLLSLGGDVAGRSNSSLNLILITCQKEQNKKTEDKIASCETP